MTRHAILPIALIVLPAAGLLTAQATLDEASADECRTTPGLIVAPSAHWYYRLNPANHKRCWFLVGKQTQSHARRPSSYVRPERSHRAPRALLKRVAKDDGGPTQIASLPLATQLLSASISEPHLPGDFAERWPDLLMSRDLNAHEVTTITYMEKALPMDAESQIKARNSRPQQYDQALRLAVLFSPLAIVLLTGAVLKIGRKADDPRGRWRENADQLGYGLHFADLDEMASRASSVTARSYASARRPLRPNILYHDIRKGPQEIMRNLQRTGTTQ
jgi:hypothetical protein